MLRNLVSYSAKKSVEIEIAPMWRGSGSAQFFISNGEIWHKFAFVLECGDGHKTQTLGMIERV